MFLAWSTATMAGTRDFARLPRACTGKRSVCLLLVGPYDRRRTKQWRVLGKKLRTYIIHNDFSNRSVSPCRVRYAFRNVSYVTRDANEYPIPGEIGPRTCPKLVAVARPPPPRRFRQRWGGYVEGKTFVWTVDHSLRVKKKKRPDLSWDRVYNIPGTATHYLRTIQLETYL